MAPQKLKKCLSFQLPDLPIRTIQNFVSSEKYDDFVGKQTVLHLLPPSSEVLPGLLEGYYNCLKRLIHDPNVDPLVCATIAKIAFNTLHPLVDGNGRVQRALFQAVLFERGYLPNMGMPVSVVMLRDRERYEMLQQKHVEQVMAGVTHDRSQNPGEDYQHMCDADSVKCLYTYQDFTHAVSTMVELAKKTLPVMASSMVQLQRYDLRQRQILACDQLLSVEMAGEIAKVFTPKGDVNISKLLMLLVRHGRVLGAKRLWNNMNTARLPDDSLTSRWCSINSKAATLQRWAGRFFGDRGAEVHERVEDVFVLFRARAPKSEQC